MLKPAIVFHPWEYLADALEAKWWTQIKLSEVIWISKYEINDIIKWRRNITPRIAFRLWEAFWTSASSWLNLQNMYDLYQIEHNSEEIKQSAKIKERVLAYA